MKLSDITIRTMPVRADNLAEVAAWCGGIACSGYVSYTPSRSEGADKAWVGEQLSTNGHIWWAWSRGESGRRQ